jgi:hypothetical protein
MHGNTTTMTAVRKSMTSAISGVATMGKPMPIAPWTKPAAIMTIAIHASTHAPELSSPVIERSAEARQCFPSCP